MMIQALDEAKKCEPKPTAFCVGCVLVTRLPGFRPVILTRGYSRELQGNTHAEANALSKAHNLSEDQIHALFPLANHGVLDIHSILHATDIYTTMEPCSIRTSGLAPCADALIKAGIQRCIIGVGEPRDFVTCEGARKLVGAGTEVVWLKGMEQECLSVARRGHSCDTETS